MTIDRIMDQIDKDRIYKTITQLEGPRHPLDNMDALNAAADYILRKLTAYGLRAETQAFKVEGFDEPFKNVIGTLGDPSKPAILLGSHYDTAPGCPGANDNLSAVAISLEVARVLALMEHPPCVIIAAFTLEEGHPWIAKQIRENCFDSGLIDSESKFISVKMKEFRQSSAIKARTYFHQGKNMADAFQSVKTELKDTLSKDETQYLDILIKANQSVLNPSSSPISHGLVGSRHYVKNLHDKTTIKEVIVYDTVGWIRNEPHTQKPLPIPREMTQEHKVDPDNQVGNFIAILGEKNSSALLNRFLKNCENEKIDIPYLGINLPFDYSQIAKTIPDFLRSDHAPFWEAGIPTIFLADTANFRSELYHTPGDISGLIDFEILKKLAQATVKTILEKGKKQER